MYFMLVGWCFGWCGLCGVCVCFGKCCGWFVCGCGWLWVGCCLVVCYVCLLCLLR